MNVIVTVYKDGLGVYPNGAQRLINTSFAIGDRGQVSLVDPSDIVIDYQKPHMDLLRLDIANAGYVYVSETEAEIVAQLGSSSSASGVNAPELVIGGSGPLSVPAGNLVALGSAIPDDTAVAMFVLNGIPLNNADVPYTPPRTYDFTAVGGLVTGILKVIY